MKKGPITVLLILIFSISYVLAVEFPGPPPPIPSEYWGQVNYNGSSVADGTPVTAEIGGVVYAEMAGGTINGYYDVIVPGNETGTSGNQGGTEGDEVVVKVGDRPNIPNVVWTSGSNDQANVTTVLLTQKILTLGWNLFSIPYIPLDSALTSVLSSIEGKYEIVWTTTACDTWKSSRQAFSPLSTLDTQHSYLIYINGTANLIIEGLPSTTTPITATCPSGGWYLAGYPSMVKRPLTTILPADCYEVVWTTTAGDTWKSSRQAFSPLTDFTGVRGYEIYFNKTCSYDVDYK